MYQSSHVVLALMPVLPFALPDNYKNSIPPEFGLAHRLGPEKVFSVRLVLHICWYYIFTGATPKGLLGVPEGAPRLSEDPNGHTLGPELGPS